MPGDALRYCWNWRSLESPAMMPSKSNATRSSLGWGSDPGVTWLSCTMRPAGMSWRAASWTSSRLADRNRSTP